MMATSLMLGLCALCVDDDGRLVVDASAPWSIVATSDAGAADIEPAPRDADDPAVVLIPRTHNELRLRLAAIPGVANRWPVSLASNFRACVESAADGVSAWAYVKNPDWKLRVFDAAPTPDCAGVTYSSAGKAVSDITEIGIGLRRGANAAAAPVRVRIEPFALQLGPDHGDPLPPRGDTIRRIGRAVAWRIDEQRQGVASIDASSEAVRLTAHLDARDVQKRSGRAWVAIGSATEPMDLTDRGVFATVRGDEGLYPTTDARCYLAVGLRDAAGRVFWGRGQPLRSTKQATTAALYPEMRFALPFCFHGEGFDPRRVTHVGLEITLEDPGQATADGVVTVRDVSLVALPPALQRQREAVAQRLGRDRWLTTLKHQPSAAPVPMEGFLERCGVNYPWPAGMYPPVGRRPWNGSLGGFADAAALGPDMTQLARCGVSLVRVFLFCDARTGIVTNAAGRLALDDKVLPDIDALLHAVERAPTIRLLPVLFDFHMADGYERRGLARVGEHPDWITDPRQREALFDAIEPALQRLCGHRQVAAIDLFNEPEHAAGVDMASMHEFLTALRQRVRRIDPTTPVTIGSADTIVAPFWQSCGIDFLSAHWFAKMDPSHALGDHSAALDPKRALLSEIDPTTGVQAALDEARRAGFAGALFWSMHGHDGYPFGESQQAAFRTWMQANTRPQR